MKRLLLIAALGFAWPASAFDISQMSAAERDAFRAEIRDYLLENPEVLMEAIGVLETREAETKAQADAALVEVYASELYEDGHSWVGGNPDGDITIVEFLDYRCTYCRRAHPDVTELVESDGNIRLIVKEFPILGQDSVTSSRLAIATLLTEGPEAYKAAHDTLIEIRSSVTEDTIDEIALLLELDSTALQEKMYSAEVDAIIAKNRSLAQEMEINGTPTFVLAGELLRGYLPLEGMKQIVAEARANN